MAEGLEPFAHVVVGDERVPVHRDNLSLFRHLANRAMFDHCYIVIPERKSGAYIWVDNPMFSEYAQLAEAHGSRIYLNIKEPSNDDIESYMKHHIEDLDDASTPQDAFPNYLK